MVFIKSLIPIFALFLFYVVSTERIPIKVGTYVWCLAPSNITQLWYGCPTKSYADFVHNTDPLAQDGYTVVNKNCLDLQTNLTYCQNDPVYQQAELYAVDTTVWPLLCSPHKFVDDEQ
eukprot:TRINITY_DN5269_c0_g1_i1.p1 TRINITY_DN5269_c0_g1~~TRINITY_DN5269_c0_g1_i1.p1  ORF type:complete len:118 (+),score=17.82 TRINITY_DN5269_c0_g1_i1:77-430(+)